MKHANSKAAAFVIANLGMISSASAQPQLMYTINQTDPWLVENCLVSATFYLSGFNNGEAIQGIVSGDQYPWQINSSGLFYNAPTVMIDDRVVFDGEHVWASPAMPVLGGPGHAFDSGFLPVTGNALFGSPNDPYPQTDAFAFARFSSGASATDQDMLWASINPSGIPVNSSTQIPVLRLTWRGDANLYLRFTVFMNTPPLAYTVSFPGILDGFGRCCLDGMCFLSSHGNCGQNGGVFIGDQPCVLCPVECPGDIAPSGGDNNVGVADLLGVVVNWGPCNTFECGYPNCSADITNDGNIGVADILAVLNAWGACQN